MPKFVTLFEAFVGHEADALRDLNLMPLQLYVHTVKFTCSGSNVSREKINTFLKYVMDRIMEEGYDTTIRNWSTSLEATKRDHRKVPIAYKCSLEIINEHNKDFMDNLVKKHLSEIFDNNEYTLTTEVEEGSMFENLKVPFITTRTLANHDFDNGVYRKGIEAICNALIPKALEPGSEIDKLKHLIDLGLLPLSAMASHVKLIVSTDDYNDDDTEKEWAKAHLSFPTMLVEKDYWQDGHVTYDFAPGLFDQFRQIFSEPRLEFSSSAYVGRIDGVKMCMWTWAECTNLYAYEKDIE